VNGKYFVIWQRDTRQGIPAKYRDPPIEFFHFAKDIVHVLL